MQKSITVLLLFFLWIGVHSLAWSQACCSAGTPLLSSLELPPTSAGTLQLALTHENNTLRDVLSGSATLHDASRRRLTHSLLLEIYYGITSFLTASVLLKAVQQERRIHSSFDGSESFLKTRGAGDAIVLLKYNVVQANIINQLDVSIGAGYRTDMILDFSLTVRFRSVTSDKFAGTEIPNTGGRWLSVVPGVNVKVLDDVAVRASGQLPVYRNLDGTQLTTSYTASLTVFYTLSLLQ